MIARDRPGSHTRPVPLEGLFAPPPLHCRRPARRTEFGPAFRPPPPGETTMNPSGPAENPFVAYVARLRAGDQAALEELVARYAPVIKLEARMRLRLAAPAGRPGLDGHLPVGPQELLPAGRGRAVRHRPAGGPAQAARPDGVQQVAGGGPPGVRPEAGRPPVGRAGGRGPPGGRRGRPGRGGRVAGAAAARPANALGRRAASWPRPGPTGRRGRRSRPSSGGTPDGLRMQFSRAQARVAEALGLEAADA